VSEQRPDQGDGQNLGIRADRGRPRSAGGQTVRWTVCPVRWTDSRHAARVQGIVDQDKDVDKQVGQWHHWDGPPRQEVIVHSFSACGGPLLSSQPTSRA
jgi:hypothetical protein